MTPPLTALLTFISRQRHPAKDRTKPEGIWSSNFQFAFTNWAFPILREMKVENTDIDELVLRIARSMHIVQMCGIQKPGGGISSNTL